MIDQALTLQNHQIMSCYPHKNHTISIISSKLMDGRSIASLKLLLLRWYLRSRNIFLLKNNVFWFFKICAAYIIVEIVVPTAGMIALVVPAGLFLWWKKRWNRRRNNNNAQGNGERQPLHQDGPGQDGPHIICNIPYGSNLEARPAPVASSQSKIDNLRGLTIGVPSISRTLWDTFLQKDIYWLLYSAKKKFKHWPC